MNNPHIDRLALLRSSMKERNIDAYLIPSNDPHLGEYVPDHWQIIPWLTGFTGSSATVVITDSFAGLWTDSRYFIQAAKQLFGTGFVLMKPVLPGKKELLDWLRDVISDDSKIALDGRIFSIERIRRFEKMLKGKKVVTDTNCDLISDLWIERPVMPDYPAFDHLVAFCGKERSVKISEIREEMKLMDVEYHLLTSIDDIMWMLNIRGGDIRYSPLMTSYAIIGEEQILIFVDEGKIPLKLAAEFDRIGVVMLPYEETAGMLSVLPPDSTILITPGTTSISLYNSIAAGMTIKEDISIPTRLKAVKNKVEIDNIQKGDGERWCCVNKTIFLD